MEIAFLHISDLHITRESSVDSAHLSALVNSLKERQQKPLGVVIIFSGDIAGTGCQSDYLIAKKFINDLISRIISEIGVEKEGIKTIIVPGNHDVNWNGYENKPTDSEIKRAFGADKEAMHQKELQHMSDYYAFSDDLSSIGINTNNQIVRKTSISIAGFEIETILINSAPFSYGRDDGNHWIPDRLLGSLDIQSDAEFSIAVMHHSKDWFGFEQKKRLENIITRRCSVVFCGHDHFIETKEVTTENKNNTIYQCSGAWWQDGSPDKSDYYVSFLDTSNRNYTIIKYAWNSAYSNYSKVNEETHAMDYKSLNGLGLTYEPKYIDNLLVDKKGNVPGLIREYFVFPKLTISPSDEYTTRDSVYSMENLIKYIEKYRYINVEGPGKTTLLKAVLSELAKKYAVLFCNTEDITGKNSDRVINDLVTDIYGRDAISQFNQISKDNKVLIIDDLHKIAESKIRNFITGVKDQFGTIIISTDKTVHYDPVQMVKDAINDSEDFKRIVISRLYADKRAPILYNVARLHINDKQKALEVADSLEQFLNSYKLGLRGDIEFVVQFANYYSQHFNELKRDEAEVFSTVFEAAIDNSISPQLYDNEDVNAIKTALGELAYYIHFESGLINKTEVVKTEAIIGVIEYYRSYYDDDDNNPLTPQRFLEITINSGIIKQLDDADSYKFIRSDFLAYFAAKALNMKFQDNRDDEKIKQVFEQACFGINGDILMYLTSIGENIQIPRLLLDQTANYLSEWQQYSMGMGDIEYLKIVNLEALLAPKSNAKQEKREELAARESEEDNIIQTVPLYDYDISSVGTLINRLTKASILLKLLAKNFTAFNYMMNNADKTNYVKALYSIPNQIFYLWAKDVDNNLSLMLSEITEWENQDEYKGKKHSEEELVRFFQKISYEMLLNLYYIPAIYGCNNKTMRFLERQDDMEIDKDFCFRIERLMFYEKVDNVKKLIDDAESILSDTKNGMIKNMVHEILYHMLINSRKISDSQKRMVLNTYFSRNKGGILLRRQALLDSTKNALDKKKIYEEHLLQDT